MNLRVRYSTDLISGLLFCAVGICGIALSSQLEHGSPARMGAGFFPMWLSVILLTLGVITLISAAVQHGRAVGDIHLRPLIAVLAGVVAFGFLVESWGFAVAGALLVFIARAAEGRFRTLETALLAAALVAVSAGIFLFGLKLPIRLWP